MPLPVDPVRGEAARVVVLISGTGTLLQALLDAGRDPAYGVAGGRGRRRPTRDRRAGAGRGGGHPDLRPGRGRPPEPGGLGRALTKEVAAYAPDLVVSAGFLKLVGPDLPGRVRRPDDQHPPALLPSFPGMHGPRDALAYGVKVTGATVFLVDAGVDTGVIVAQAAVPVADDDTRRRCTSGSRWPSGTCWSTSPTGSPPGRWRVDDRR